MHALDEMPFEGAWKRHQAVLVAKCAALPGILKVAGLADDVSVQKFQTLLEQVSGLSATDLLAEATPFLWSNVDRCATQALLGEGDLVELARFVLAAAFDSLFHRLPDETTFEFDVERDPDLLLPKLGLRVPGSALPARIRRTAGGCLEVANRHGVTRINPLAEDRPHPFSDPRIRISSGSRAWVLHAPNHSLVDHISVLESVPLSSDVEPFRAMMAAALELIAAVHPTLAAQIENIIGWYVPVRTNDIKTHRSFTVERMPGVMFLSEAIDPAILAEAIVHEFYHTVLHVVTETEDVFGTVDPQQKFYSPWRDDPRPLPGLFHAIYVFSGVVEFYARAERVLEPGQLAIVHQRQGKLQQQLRMAMAQIPRSQLAPAGDRIMTRIENLLAACPLVAIDSSAQQTMESHLLAWSQSNPALAAQVRRPEA